MWAWLSKLDVNAVWLAVMAAIGYLHTHNFRKQIAQAQGYLPPGKPSIAPATKVGLLLIAFSMVLGFSCSARSKQATIGAGQCILDSGVLAAVIGDLEQSNYAQLVGDLIGKDGQAAVTCALTSIATTYAAPAGAEPNPLGVRARELLKTYGGK